MTELEQRREEKNLQRLRQNNAEQAQELARIRRINLEAGQVPPNSKPYKRAEVCVIDSNVLLDPERPVLNAWKRTAYDGATGQTTTIILDASRPAGQQINPNGEGFGTLANDWNGPFKLRCLRGPRIGEVIDVDSITYCLARLNAAKERSNPSWEPVPDETRCRPPLLPEGFPSNFAKARKLAGRGLKRSPDELTLTDCIAYFEKRREAQREILK